MLKFNIYGLTNATRKAAGLLLALGLLLVGLGFLVILLKAVFIVIVAAIIFLAALWCISTAIKMFAMIYRTTHRKGYDDDDPQNAYRKNVRIHNSDTFDDY
jgi:cobalamin biosynthesis protein CobD/CbiB